MAVTASAALLLAAGCVAALAIPRAACAAPHQVLGVVAGPGTFDGGTLPARAIGAMRAVRRSGGFEGVWYEAGHGVFVGVYGPTWDRARVAAAAVSNTPGPRITYVCQPATERQLHATQDAIGRSTLWQDEAVGFTDIDTRNALVLVGVNGSAPASTEHALVHDYGSRLRIERSHGPFVDMAPGRGRMPMAATAAQAHP